jgi:hypothetical protein
MPIVELAGGSTLPTPSPVAIIRPDKGEPWVLSAGFFGLGQLYGSPNSDELCVVERHSRVVFVNVKTHGQTDQWIGYPVHVSAALDHGLLLVAESNSITAIRAGGVCWVATAVVGADLHITRSDGDRIYFRGFDVNGVNQLRGSLDASTGEVF